MQKFSWILFIVILIPTSNNWGASTGHFDTISPESVLVLTSSKVIQSRDKLVAHEFSAFKPVQSILNTVEGDDPLTIQKHMLLRFYKGVKCETEKDFVGARQLYKSAAILGLPEAQHNYAFMCHYGEGGPINLPEARLFYKLAADQGIEEAQYSYALLSLDGKGGPQNLIEARKYFEMAANKGYRDAQFPYAYRCENEMGGSQDLIVAKKYYKMAADGASKDARYRYGLMCKNGTGDGIQNLSEAIHYLELAAAQGMIEAIEILAEINTHV